MYLDFFKLRELPFSLVSDPRFLYLGEDHAKVKAYIEYAMRSQDSFLICTGEIGTGKTTLVNDALKQGHQHTQVVRIQVNHLSSEEFLQQLLLEFGIEPYGLQRIQVLDKVKRHLAQQFRAGQKVFLIVDEAHNASSNILEDIRHLSDMEQNGSKMLGVILVGQPELNDLIGKPEMEHIAQRIRLRCHIKPLNPNETASYINHRLKIAGFRNMSSIFDDECMSVIHQFTGGRIRLINTLCDYALLHCCVEKISHVNSLVIQKAANELQWEVYDKRYGETSDVTRFLMPSSDLGEAKLIVKHHSQVIDEVKLKANSLTIGRQSDNDIPVDDFKVSRYHAQIVVQGSVCYLHDLGSTNGTFINKQKVGVHRLNSSDVFSVGAYEFIFMQALATSVVDMTNTMSHIVESSVSLSTDTNVNGGASANQDKVVKDVTRQMPLDKRDQTRIRYQHPYISLVSSESDVS